MLATHCRHLLRHLSGVRAVPPPGLSGIVSSVAGDVIKIIGVPDGRVHSLLTFQSGATGLITELHSDGVVRAVLISGVGGVSPGEGVLVESGSPALPSIITAHPDALLGRVVSVLGEPLDGLGALKQSPTMSHPRHPGLLFPPSSPSIVSRAPLSQALPTGYKTLDALHPLLRGTCLALCAPKGVDKERVALDIVSTLASRSATSTSSAGVRCIYVSVGQSLQRLSSTIAHLSSTGALPYTCIVASPPGTEAAFGRGAAYLAPFTGAAIGEVWRDRGLHGFLCIDDLTEHAQAVRGVEGVYGIMPSALQASVADRCAQLSGEWGGGSLTGLALMEIEANATASASSTSAGGEGATDNTAVSEARAALSEEGGVGGGRTTTYLANTASLCDGGILTLSPKAAASGALLPFDFERLGGWGGHAAQGQSLRYYTHSVTQFLEEVGGAAKGVALGLSMGIDPESDSDALLDLYTKARLLLCPTEELLKGVMALSKGAGVHSPDGARQSASRVAILGLQGLAFESEEEEEEMRRAALGGEEVGVERKSAAAIAASASMKKKGGVRHFSSSSSSSSTPVPLAGRLEDLKKKLDPVQLQTLEAVREMRRGGGKKRVGGGERSALASMASAPSRSGGGGVDFSALYDDGEEAAAGELEANNARKEKVKEKEREEEEEVEEVGRDGAQPFAPPSSSPFAAGRRYFSTSTTSSRPRFIVPSGSEHRTPPPQLFQSVMREALEAARSSKPLSAGYTDTQLLGWEPSPARGDAGRTFLNLFILTHGYVSPVPLHRLFAYERGLWMYLSRIPAPPPSEVMKGGGGEEEEEGRASTSPPFLTPSSQDILGYTSLLHAALAAPVPVEMAEYPRHPLSESLQAIHTAAIARGAAEARERYDAAVAAEVAAEAAVREKRKLQKSTNFIFSSLFSSSSSKKKEGEEEKVVAASPPPLPSLSSGKTPEEEEFESVLGEVRTNPGPPLSALSPVWVALHVSVAAYTRKFCHK